MLCKDFAYKGLLKYFEIISSIPRGTFDESRIADYLCGFAKERALECHRDASNNVFIRMNASEGRESDPPLLLQGHIDMVCEKNDGVEHDFKTDGLELYESDGWIRAKGTTLGADNGVAVAAMLYILDGADGNLASNPPIECLFTASEEVGLSGASDFDCSLIKARKMINMDSADESQIICGCAGAQRVDVSYVPKRREIDKNMSALEVFISGLAGGHSGEDIHRCRANANKLMGRILQDILHEQKLNLISVNGGSKENAIPRECRALVAVCEKEAFIQRVKEISEDIKTELCTEDEGFKVLVVETDSTQKMMCAEDTEKVVFFMSTVQNGVIEMSSNIEGLVEFSRNLGIINTNEDQIRFVFMSRSAKLSQLKLSFSQINAYAKMLSMNVRLDNEYPGWDFAPFSELRDKYSQSYRELCGEDPEITAIHAGLECGVIKNKVPDMDIISCGPVVINLHSPDEALNIASFERFFEVIKRTIEK